MNLNQTIQALRADKRLTQEQLAELVGVSTAAVSKWECGNSYPDITLLPKLAEIFDVSLDYLFGYRKAEEKTIPETIAEANRLGKEGKREEAISLLRQTLERYPQHEILLFELARHIFVSMRFRSSAKRRERLREATEIFLSVAERTQSANRRAWCYQFLTAICMATQDYVQAEKYNNQLLTGRGMYPKVTAAVISQKLRSREEADSMMENTMAESLYEYVYMGNWYVFSLFEGKRYREIITVCDRTLRIIDVGIKAGQAYLFNEASDFAECKALAYAHMGQQELCLDSLESAYEYACQYDTLDYDFTYDVYDLTGEMHDVEERISSRANLLRTLQCDERREVYASLRDNPRYQALLARLQDDSSNNT
ncbi:MAG: helix-turn-helix domain-containing protein [Clostridia bacterium]|nr:helix-turn-helix domain-containing protein [Clostridia bacterium]